MRAVVQRVKNSSVSVSNEVVGSIEQGLLVLLGVEEGDTKDDAEYLAEKIVYLRIFEDAESKFNFDVLHIGGKILAVSQFTLLGDVRHGRRPSFTQAAEPVRANELYRAFVDEVKKHGVHVEEGIFQTKMDVHLVNDGPVTILIDSKKKF